MAPTETVRPLAFDAGFTVAGLATDAARLITGDTVHIDGGYHIMG